MIDLDQLKKSNDHDWHKPYGGQITLNCEDVDELIKMYEELLDKYERLNHSYGICVVERKQLQDKLNEASK